MASRRPTYVRSTRRLSLAALAVPFTLVLGASSAMAAPAASAPAASPTSASPGAAGAAPAAPPAAPSAADRDTARRLMDEGKASTASGDLAHALESYEKAHAIMHVPTTGIAVAKTRLSLGQFAGARAMAIEVAAIPRDPAEPPVFEQARKQAKQIQTEAEAKAATLRIHVRGGPPDQLTIDGREVPVDQLREPLVLDPGTHAIVARKPDAEGKAEVVLAERDKKEVEVELFPIGAAAGGPRKVAGFSLDEERGGERTTTAKVLMIGGFGLGAAGLVAGGVTGFLAASKASDVKAQCENGICDPAAESDLASARSMATISNIGFAVGIVGAAVGVVGLVLPRARSARTGFVVLPSGAAVAGQF